MQAAPQHAGRTSPFPRAELAVASALQVWKIKSNLVEICSCFSLCKLGQLQGHPSALLSLLRVVFFNHSQSYCYCWSSGIQPPWYLPSAPLPKAAAHCAVRQFLDDFGWDGHPVPAAHPPGLSLLVVMGMLLAVVQAFYREPRPPM